MQEGRLEEPFNPTLEASVETAAVKPVSRPFRFQMFSSLRHIDFRYLCTGTFMMSAGQWIQQVTLGWLIYDLTANSMLLGVLNGVRALPFLVTGPMAGVAADRMNRKRLCCVRNGYSIVTALFMGGVVACGFLEVWHIFVFTLVTGVAWTFTEPVRQSMIPNLVPKKSLPTQLRSIPVASI